MSDYTRVLKGLRHCINLDGLEPNDTRIRCHGCPYFTEPTRCGGILMRDAAAAIEDLQTELGKEGKRVEHLLATVNKLEDKMPKRGEWELIDGAEPMRWGCSRCKYLSWETSNYCPRCGAEMNDSNASNALNALDNAQDGPIITPCRGCSDYDGYGGCKSKGGCARKLTEVQE